MQPFLIVTQLDVACNIPDIFRILRSHTNADISDLIQQYFQNVY